MCKIFVTIETTRTTTESALIDVTGKTEEEVGGWLESLQANNGFALKDLVEKNQIEVDYSDSWTYRWEKDL